MDLPRDSDNISSSIAIRLRRSLLGMSVAKVILLFFGFYVLSGLFFAILYKITPLGIDCSGTQPVRALECIYFSFTTQATVGYGDFVPCGIDRLISIVQAARRRCVNLGDEEDHDAKPPRPRPVQATEGVTGPDKKHFMED